MPENGGQEALLSLAVELRELAGRIANVVDALVVENRPDPRPAIMVAIPPPEPEPQPRPDDRPPLAEPDGQYADWDDYGRRTEETMAAEPGADWDNLGGRSLAWVGGAVTVAGVVLLLILGAQQGWLGPVPRLLCGAVFAALLLAAGGWLHRNPSGRAGSYALVATGFTALYLDVLAATALYHYLDAVGGLLVALLVAVTGLLLADFWVTEGLAVFVVLAAAAGAPVIVGGVTPMLVAFLLVLAGAATPAQLRRDWRYLAFAAHGPVLVALLVLDGLARHSDVRAVAVAAMVTTVLWLALAVGTSLRNPDDVIATVVVAAAPVPVMSAAALLDRTTEVAALAVVTVLLFAIWVVHWTWDLLPARFAATAGIAGAVTLAEATALGTLGHGAALTITLLCQSMLFAVVARRTRGTGALAIAACYCAVGTVAALLGPLPMSLLVRVALGPSGVTPLAVAVLVMVAALVLCWAVLPRGVWWAVCALGFVALYGFSGTVLSAALLAAPDGTGFRIGQVAITIGWTACALGLLVVGVRRLPARVAGLTLVGAALLKLLLFDLVMLDGLVRVCAFLGAGVVLLTAGVRYARIVSTNR